MEMEISFEGFSIREYTSNIRDTNVEKTWPFDGNPNDTKKEVMEELLQPLTCKKFKWWCHELECGIKKPEVVLEEKGVMMSCPVCLSFKASTVNAVSVHVNSCLKKEKKKMKMIDKAKSRQPKKKSIMEIFAVSPQIEDQDQDQDQNQEDEDEDENEDEDRLCDIIANVNRKKRKAIAKKASPLHKEKAHKLKSSIKLGLVKKLKASINGKKLASKNKLSRQPSKMKTISASKLSKHYQVTKGNPVHSILKKFTSVPQTSSTEGNSWDDYQEKHSQHVKKHVRFSDSMVLPSVNHQLEEWDNISRATDETAEVNRNSEETETITLDRAALQSMYGNRRLKYSDYQVLPPSLRNFRNWNRKDKGEARPDESRRISVDVLPQDPDLSRLKSPSQISPYGGSGDHSQEDATNHRKMSATTSSLTSRREADRRRLLHTEETSQKLSRSDMQSQTFLEQLPKDCMTSICSSVDEKRRKAAMYGSKFTGDDFIGLPLNSQGELIKLHSSGMGGSHQLRNQNTMNTATNFHVSNVVQSESTSKNQGKMARQFLPEYSSFKIPDTPSEIGSTESQNNCSIHQLGLDLNQMNLSSCRCSQSTKEPNQTPKEKILWVESEDGEFLPTAQPTMRLMGRDVTVGIKDKKPHASEDDKIWTDKKVIKEQFPTVEIENPTLDRNFPMEAPTNASSGMSKETRNRLLEHPGNHTRPYLSQMKDIGQCLDQTYSKWKPNEMRQSDPQSIAEDQRVQMPHFSLPLTFHELMNRNSKTPGTSINGPESQNLSCQLELSTSSQNPCKCMRSNCSQSLQNQSLHCASSRFQFPFDTQVFEQCVPSLSQSSSSNLPHWMLNTSQQKESPVSCSGYDVSGVNSQFSGSRTSSSGVSFPSMSSPPNRHDSPLPRTQGLSGAYLVRRPHNPVPPSLRPNPSLNTGYGYKMNNNKNKPHLVHRKGPSLSARTKKRPADNTDCSTGSSKRPALETPVESTDVMDTVKGVTYGGKRARGAAETDTREHGRKVQHSLTEIYKDGPGFSPGVCSSNMDSVARLGPVKLSAGAKHILKPSLNTTDKDDSRLIHSTIPFGSVKDSSKDSELQKNQARIYRL